MSEKFEKRKTDLPHIFVLDWADDGILKEVAIVLEKDDGTIHGIEIDRLHPIDKARLKKIITSTHADKYPLWELMSQSQLSNGYNSLDFFHSNYVKVKRPRGAVSLGGLSNFTYEVDDSLIGAKFSDPRGASIASETPKL